MLTKIHHLYPNSIIIRHQSTELFSENYVWFREPNEDIWLGIPVQDIHDKELSILKSLLPYHESIPMNNKGSRSWYQFLFKNGELPPVSNDIRYRVLHFHLNGKDLNTDDIESAIKGFFPDDIIIIWESEFRLYIVERERKHPLDEEGLYSLSKTFETDLFINAFIYCGRFTFLTKEYPENFQKERTFFHYALELSPQNRVFSFEKIFPRILTAHMAEELSNGLFSSIGEVFKDDPDLFISIKVLLENNLNVSVTSKKLYVHRNTLQYRIDKFTDKTGINLKDFNSAVTVYFACLAMEIIPS